MTGRLPAATALRRRKSPQGIAFGKFPQGRDRPDRQDAKR